VRRQRLKLTFPEQLIQEPIIYTLAKRFGAAVIALTIDEDGMAKDVERKIEVARRLYDFAVNRYGLEREGLPVFAPDGAQRAASRMAPICVSLILPPL
jgi:cobalamin-dependent methionine synthase I